MRDSRPPSAETVRRLDAVIDSMFRGETWPRHQGGGGEGHGEPGSPSYCRKCGEVLTPDTWCGNFSGDSPVNICTRCQTPMEVRDHRRRKRYDGGRRRC